VNILRIEACDSSGKNDVVAEEYHVNGTRSHAVSGVAWLRPSEHVRLGLFGEREE
jgi:hypothetical protein